MSIEQNDPNLQEALWLQAKSKSWGKCRQIFQRLQTCLEQKAKGSQSAWIIQKKNKKVSNWAERSQPACLVQAALWLQTESKKEQKNKSEATNLPGAKSKRIRTETFWLQTKSKNIEQRAEFSKIRTCLPCSGSSAKTTSPRASAAYDVIPTRASAPSLSTHLFCSRSKKTF